MVTCNEGSGTVDSYPVTPVPAGELVDTNGAGDCFVGGLLAGLLSEVPLARCVQAAHYCASVNVRRTGCTFPQEPPQFTLARGQRSQVLKV